MARSFPCIAASCARMEARDAPLSLRARAVPPPERMEADSSADGGGPEGVPSALPATLGAFRAEMQALGGGVGAASRAASPACDPSFTSSARTPRPPGEGQPAEEGTVDSARDRLFPGDGAWVAGEAAAGDVACEDATRARGVRLLEAVRLAAGDGGWCVGGRALSTLRRREGARDVEDGKALSMDPAPSPPSRERLPNAACPSGMASSAAAMSRMNACAEEPRARSCRVRWGAERCGAVGSRTASPSGTQAQADELRSHAAEGGTALARAGGDAPGHPAAPAPAADAAGCSIAWWRR